MNGKLQIIGKILQIDRPFRVSHITDMTGLDRNLVRYHIVRFCEAGYLEKIDRTYLIKNREGLLESMLESADKVETKKMEAGGLVRKEQADILNAQADIINAGRALDLPMSDQAKQVMLDKIDETIRQYKNLRKYLANSSRTERSAAKFFKQNFHGEWEPIWTIYTKFYGGQGFDVEEFTKAAKSAMLELVE